MLQTIRNQFYEATIMQTNMKLTKKMEKSKNLLIREFLLLIEVYFPCSTKKEIIIKFPSYAYAQ